MRSGCNVGEAITGKFRGVTFQCQSIALSCNVCAIRRAGLQMRFDVQRLLRAKEGSKFRDAFFGKVLKNALSERLEPIG